MAEVKVNGLPKMDTEKSLHTRFSRIMLIGVQSWPRPRKWSIPRRPSRRRRTEIKNKATNRGGASNLDPHLDILVHQHDDDEVEEEAKEADEEEDHCGSGVAPRGHQQHHRVPIRRRPVAHQRHIRRVKYIHHMADSLRLPREAIITVPCHNLCANYNRKALLLSFYF